jgi:hypothetical protein
MGIIHGKRQKNQEALSLLKEAHKLFNKAGARSLEEEVEKLIRSISGS